MRTSGNGPSPTGSQASPWSGNAWASKPQNHARAASAPGARGASSALASTPPGHAIGRLAETGAARVGAGAVGHPLDLVPARHPGILQGRGDASSVEGRIGPREAGRITRPPRERRRCDEDAGRDHGEAGTRPAPQLAWKPAIGPGACDRPRESQHPPDGPDDVDVRDQGGGRGEEGDRRQLVAPDHGDPQEARECRQPRHWQRAQQLVREADQGRHASSRGNTGSRPERSHDRMDGPSTKQPGDRRRARERRKHRCHAEHG